MDRLLTDVTKQLGNFIQAGEDQIKVACSEAMRKIDDKIAGIAEKTQTANKSYADALKTIDDKLTTYTSPTVEGSDIPHGTAKLREANDVTTVVDEYVDRERRRCNLVIHNVPEPDGEFEARKAQDQATFTDMVRSEFRLQVKVNKAIRLGKKMEDRARLILVTLDSEESKREVLRHATQLRHSTNWSNVYISPDLTPAERETSKKLREELKRRREEGEPNLTIRGGRIITSRVIATKQRSQSIPQPVTIRRPNENDSALLPPEVARASTD